MTKKSFGPSHKQILPWLLAVGIAYQLVYQLVLLNEAERAEHATRDECAAGGVGRADPASPLCMEAQLFSGWHQAELDSDDSTLDLERYFKLNATVAIGIGGASSAKVADPGSSHAAQDGGDAKNDQPVLRSLPVDWAKELQELEVLEASINASLNSHADNSTPWTRGLEETQHRLEAEMPAHLKTDVEHANAKLQRQKHMDQLIAETKASLNSHSGSVTPWAKGLQELQKRLEAKSKLLEEHHREHASAAANEASHITPWAKGLQELQSRLEANMQVLRKHHHRHLSAIVHVTQTEEQDSHASKHMRGTNISVELGQMNQKLHTRLAGIASEHKSWEAELLSKYGISIESSTQSPSSTFLSKRLQWSSVSSALQVTAGDKVAAVSRNELRHLKWSGRIPKVACIAAVKGTTEATARMMYFIDNFKLQDYEGPRQLVLVYHHADQQAAKLISKYADGTFIKGLPARGDDDVFPSTAALRYGAWSSDADVVARWDFNEWHDPRRLSMQVRSLAFTGRPASVTVGSVLASDAQPHTDAKASSLLGERAWMWKHWLPFSEADAASLNKNHGFIAEVDMSAPSTQSHAQKEHGSSHVEAAPQEGQHWTLKACLDLQGPAPKSADEALASAIEERLDRKAGEDFRKLAKRRHDVVQRLQLLCMEASMEPDAGKRQSLEAHTQQMLTVRQEMDAHFAATAQLYGVPQ